MEKDVGNAVICTICLPISIAAFFFIYNHRHHDVPENSDKNTRHSIVVDFTIFQNRFEWH